jgi:hypothetical protein
MACDAAFFPFTGEQCLHTTDICLEPTFCHSPSDIFACVLCEEANCGLEGLQRHPLSHSF